MPSSSFQKKKRTSKDINGCKPMIRSVMYERSKFTRPSSKRCLSPDTAIRSALRSGIHSPDMSFLLLLFPFLTHPPPPRFTPSFLMCSSLFSKKTQHQTHNKTLAVRISEQIFFLSSFSFSFFCFSRAFSRGDGGTTTAATTTETEGGGKRYNDDNRDAWGGAGPGRCGDFGRGARARLGRS